MSYYGLDARIFEYVFTQTWAGGVGEGCAGAGVVFGQETPGRRADSLSLVNYTGSSRPDIDRTD